MKMEKQACNAGSLNRGNINIIRKVIQQISPSSNTANSPKI